MEEPPRIERKESMERPPRYRTIEKKTIEVLHSGEHIEEVLECNEVNHRLCRDKVSYHKDGEIDYAEQLEKQELGPCDHNHA